MGPWTALGACPNAICFGNNSILFVNLSIVPCQPPSSFPPAGQCLPLRARGSGGSRNLKRMRPRAGATSQPPAGQRLRGLRGGAGRGDAGRRDLRLSGADAAQWDLRAVAAAARCAPGGGVQRQLLASPGGRDCFRCLSRCIREGVVSAPPWPPSPLTAQKARVLSRTRQPLAACPAGRASCIMCGKGAAGGGRVAGRCWGAVRASLRPVEPAGAGVWRVRSLGVRRGVSRGACGCWGWGPASGSWSGDLGGHLRGGRALEGIWGCRRRLCVKKGTRSEEHCLSWKRSEG